MLIPTDTDRLGVIATGHVEPVVTWVDGPNGRRVPGDQATEEGTGLPLWTVHAMVPTDSRPALIAVRVPSKDCPQPVALAPVAFEHLVADVRVQKTRGECQHQLVTYWQAAGVSDPARRHSRQDQAAA